MCTAGPKAGRYAAQVNLGSGQLVTIALPVNTSAPLQSAPRGFKLAMWVRSSPSGIVVALQAAAGGRVVGGTNNPAADPRESGGTWVGGSGAGGSTTSNSTIHSEWTHITANFSWANAGDAIQTPPLLLRIQSHVPSGGMLFIDEITLEEAVI